MSPIIYIFPLTVEESMQPHKMGFNLILKNISRCVEIPGLSTDGYGLNNYDKGRNLIVYNNVVYEIFKDYSDVSNNKRYFMLKPLVTGCEQITN